MPKAAIYDPYLDTLGGGERYCLTVAEILLAQGWQVDLFWSGSPDVLAQSISRFSLNLDGINVVPDIFGLKTTNIDDTQDERIEKFISHQSIRPSLIKKYNFTKKYDFCFYLSDGSLPFLFAKNNILHIQVPFVNELNSRQHFLNILKSRLINKVICNSEFTASFVPKYLASKSEVIYPPVDVQSMDNSQAKQHIILSVGRFDNILNSKKQEILIDVFRKFVKQNPGTDWKLILMGGSRQKETENHYLLFLKNQALDLPVEFIINPNFDVLSQVYSKSKIYWHAAGYGVDQDKHPELCEHFGITPVEAMASGLVPILVNKGGLPEIITDGQDGFLWDDPSQLLAKTQILITAPVYFQTMQKNAIESSKQFSKTIFKNKIINLLNLK